MKCSCSVRNVVWPLAILAIAVATMTFLSRPAPTPAVFDEGLSLSAAMQRSEETGRPVFAVATADWCPPCQSLKRGALTDPRVADALRRSTVPVYLDATDSASPGAADAARLGVSALPTMLIIRDGEVIAAKAGDQSAADLLAWIEVGAG